MLNNNTAMVIMAHPDDAEYGCAGTVANWVQHGWNVHYVICTDASGGGSDDATTVGTEARQAIAEIRKAEQRAACSILGVQDITFLDYPDGVLEPTLELRKDLVRLIRIIRPERVICQSPDYSWDPRRRYHADHLAAGHAAMAALYPAAQNPWDFPELLAQGLTPHKVHTIYVLRAPVLNYVEDISETFELKLKALQAHRSQVDAHFEQLAERLRKEHRECGAKYSFTYAEEFYCLNNAR